jgi:hypothetical protein
MFKIDATKLHKSIANLHNGLESALGKALQEVAEQGANVARTQHEYKSHGGNGLEANTVAYKNSALDQGIIANKPYASWVEYGNGPAGSRIYPVSAKALHFVVNGQEVFAKSVKASAPKPFMAKALSFVNQSGANIVHDHLNNFFKGL